MEYKLCLSVNSNDIIDGLKGRSIDKLKKYYYSHFKGDVAKEMKRFDIVIFIDDFGNSHILKNKKM
jgi:hypothetical protein